MASSLFDMEILRLIFFNELPIFPFPVVKARIE